MEKSLLIGKAPGPCSEKVAYIGVGSPVDEGVIWLAGNHQHYLHPGPGRNLQRRQDGVVRHKIRRLNINVLPGLVEKLQIIVPDLPVHGVRPAGNDLDSHLRNVDAGDFSRLVPHIRPICGNVKFKIPGILEQVFPHRIIPVQGKPYLKA